jgi:hypothetical protein
MIGFGIVAMFSWALAMAIGQNDQNQKMVDLLAALVVVFGIGVILLASLRAFLLQKVQRYLGLTGAA